MPLFSGPLTNMLKLLLDPFLGTYRNWAFGKAVPHDAGFSPAVPPVRFAAADPMGIERWSEGFGGFSRSSGIMEMNDAKSSDYQIHNKDTIPSSASADLNPRSRDERFSEEEHYEWFKDYYHFRHLVLQRVGPGSSVLELGCGNSQLCDNMFEDGIADITCIDLSATAVERMRKRISSKGYKGIKVLEADMLDLPFPNEQYDVVIEKGTMDVLFVDSGDPWDPHAASISKVMKMLQEVHRVLKSNGVFISITFGQPHFRRPLFESQEFSWSVEWSTFGDGFHYFFYTLKKGHRSLGSDEPNEKLEVPTISLLHEELEDEDFLFRTNIGGIDL